MNTIFEQDGGTYSKEGDYLVPDLLLTAKEQQPIDKYGMLRERFLQEHRKGIYSAMVLTGKLFEHLHEVDEQAHDFVSRTVKEVAAVQGVDEALKARDQMAWVGAMNAIKAQAEEVALREIVYC